MGEAALSVPQALISRLARASRILSAATGTRHVSKEASLAHRARSVTLSTYWASSTTSSRSMWFRLNPADDINHSRSSGRHSCPSTASNIYSREMSKRMRKNIQSRPRRANRRSTTRPVVKEEGTPKRERGWRNAHPPRSRARQARRPPQIPPKSYTVTCTVSTG